MIQKQSILLAALAALLVSAIVSAVPLTPPSTPGYSVLPAPNYYARHHGQSAPVLSGCTDGCTIASYSNSSRGVVTCSGGTGTPCTVTFDSAGEYDIWGEHPPACVVSTTASGGTRLNSAPTTTAFSFTLGGDGQYDYFCDGMATE